MNEQPNSLSQDRQRNAVYAAMLDSCRLGKATVAQIIAIGHKLMRKAKLHHHYFGDYSLLNTATYLTYYSLEREKSHKNANDKITEQEATEIICLFERRIVERIPTPYITNEIYYCGHKFYVNENVLVPRSIMSSRFQDFLNAVTWENNSVLDLCTGSGCIGITLALMKPDVNVDLVDISSNALEVARINVHAHLLNNRVQCIQSDLFENINQQYDLIISNPPYVSISEYEACAEEFKNEPRIALEAGTDGLAIIDRILKQAKSYLTPNGMLIAEVGEPAAKRLKQKYPKIAFRWYKHRKSNGNESMFGKHCIFICKKVALP